MIMTINSAQFDEFEAAMRGVDGRYLLVDRSQRSWNINVIDLDGLTVMDGRNGATCLYHGACQPGSYGLFVPVSQCERLTFNGRQMQHGEVGWIPPVGEFNVPSSVGFNWIGVVVGETHVQRWLEAGLVAPRMEDVRSGRACESSIQRVVEVTRSTLRVAANDPQSLQLTSSRESLRQQLLDATLGTLQSMEPGRASRKGRPRIGRTEVLRRVLGFVDEFIDQPIQVMDFCATADVSAATLQNIFSEQFGISPHRYLMLRRLHAIHSAIRRATPLDTVSTICARFGVWDFGRFSDAYRRQFGELPSRSLARARDGGHGNGHAIRPSGMDHQMRH